MIDIELVIKIPKEEYEYLKAGHAKEVFYGDAIANGTPLPEHHSDLIDKKEVYKKFYNRCLAEVATKVLDEVSTIIPATKEGDGE